MIINSIKYADYGADPKNFSCQLEQDLYNSELKVQELREALDTATRVALSYAEKDEAFRHNKFKLFEMRKKFGFLGESK